MRKWWLRYQLNGIEGLRSRSRRPLHSPNTKVSNHHEQLILDLRTQRNLGARRIQSELLCQHTLSLGLATIHKVLQKHEVKPIKKLRKKNDYIRYARPLPGDRVQMDTCKIAPGLYQYTSVDDCTRYRVLRLYSDVSTLNLVSGKVLTHHYALARQGTQAERIEQEALKAGALTSEELHRWQTGLEQADSEGIYFSSVNVMMFVGRKN